MQTASLKNLQVLYVSMFHEMGLSLTLAGPHKNCKFERSAKKRLLKMVIFCYFLQSKCIFGALKKTKKLLLTISVQVVLLLTCMTALLGLLHQLTPKHCHMLASN